MSGRELGGSYQTPSQAPIRDRRATTRSPKSSSPAPPDYPLMSVNRGERTHPPPSARMLPVCTSLDSHSYLPMRAVVLRRGEEYPRFNLLMQLVLVERGLQKGRGAFGARFGSRRRFSCSEHAASRNLAAAWTVRVVRWRVLSRCRSGCGAWVGEWVAGNQ